MTIVQCRQLPDNINYYKRPVARSRINYVKPERHARGHWYYKVLNTYLMLLEAEWSGEALRIMAGLTAGQLLHAQVAGYDEAGLPLVHLYLTLHPQVSTIWIGFYHYEIFKHDICLLNVACAKLCNWIFQQVIFLNRELVDRGLAEWAIPPDSWAARGAGSARRARRLHYLRVKYCNDAD